MTPDLWKALIGAIVLVLTAAAFGFDFLGVHILPYRVYPGTRVLKNCKKAVVNPDNDQAKQESRINSYEGMFKHLNGTIC